MPHPDHPGDDRIEPTADTNDAGVAEAFATTGRIIGPASSVVLYVDATNTVGTIKIGVYADSGSGHQGRRAVARFDLGIRPRRQQHAHQWYIVGFRGHQNRSFGKTLGGVCPSATWIVTGHGKPASTVWSPMRRRPAAWRGCPTSGKRSPSTRIIWR